MSESGLIKAQSRIEDLASDIIYSILNSERLIAMSKTGPIFQTLGDLKKDNNELYKTVIASLKDHIREANNYAS